MKKTKLVLRRDQIKILTTDQLPRIGGGRYYPDSYRCLTNVTQKGDDGQDCNSGVIRG
jgi:hypothetical protein